MAIRAAISLESVRAKKVCFVINEEHDMHQEQSINLGLEFDIDFELDDTSNLAKVVLSCNVNRDDFSQKPFMMEVSMEGLFNYEVSEDKEQVKRMLKTNSIAILFPYLRALISTMSVNFGIPTIVIPTINIIELLKEKESQTR